MKQSEELKKYLEFSQMKKINFPHCDSSKLKKQKKETNERKTTN